MPRLPARRFIVVPIKGNIVALRVIYYYLFRLLISEPIFKAYCKKYGRNLTTGTFIHYIIGKGDIIIGDNVLLDGKMTFIFAMRFAERPTLEIGDNTAGGHDCRFVVGKRITIGRNVNISGGVMIMDSNGHPTDPDARAPPPSPIR